MANLSDDELDALLRRTNNAVIEQLDRTIDVEARLRDIHNAARRGNEATPEHDQAGGTSGRTLTG